MSQCCRCGTNERLHAGCYAACGTWAGQDAEEKSRRLAFWDLQLCQSCLQEAHLESNLGLPDDPYEMMAITPVALIFGLLCSYYFIKPDSGSGDWQDAAVGMASIGCAAYGFFGGPWYVFDFHRKRRRQQRQYRVEVAAGDIPNAYAAEAERLLSLLRIAHASKENSQDNPTPFANIELPMPKGIGEPDWSVTAINTDRQELRNALATPDYGWSEALQLAEHEATQ